MRTLLQCTNIISTGPQISKTFSRYLFKDRDGSGNGNPEGKPDWFYRRTRDLKEWALQRLPRIPPHF